MTRTRTRKNCVKNTGVKTKKEEPQRVRPTVIRCTRGRTTMGAGNSQVYEMTPELSQKAFTSKAVYPLNQTQSVMDNHSINTSGIQEENTPNPTKTYLDCSSALMPACIKGLSNGELLQCPQSPSTILCGSCLYPCTSAPCPNKLCPLVATLLTCEVVTDPGSKVFGCPMFRACPKCHNLIMHENGCKFVVCASCRYQFCFICLQGDCSKDSNNYWSLTCTKQTAERQRFKLADS